VTVSGDPRGQTPGGQTLTAGRSEHLPPAPLDEPTRAHLQAAVQRFAGRRVVVVGDVMLDQFIVGRVQRISPEAPVPVVEHLRDEYRLGGAANVAHNLRALGANPVLVGVTGDDDAGELMRASLAAADIAGDRLVQDAARPTTRKVRIVTNRQQQVARIDYESDLEISGEVERMVIARVLDEARDADIVVVSDYLKGAVTWPLMQQLRALREQRGVRVLVDPKIPHLRYYAGAAIVTPNHHEAEIATHRRIRTTDDARAAARAFRELAECESVVITRGEQGLWLAEGERPAPGQLPHETSLRLETNLSARAREVADVTGAGDTVIAALAAALAAGASLRDAAELANHAASVAVARFGPAAVTADDLQSVLAGA
jgi:D-beta-D-heptose 7-phosphate kinase/D-beta-D-heptose 1-phosphate adenosyltransferase